MKGVTLIIVVIFLISMATAQLGFNNERLPRIDVVSIIVSTFLELTDTPSSYAGSGGLCVKVNNDTNALFFEDCNATGGGGGNFNYNETLIALLFVNDSADNLNDTYADFWYNQTTASSGDFNYNETIVVLNFINASQQNSSNITDSKFHYNQTTGTFNLSYQDFSYNQTGLGNSSNITDSKFHYNMTTGTFNESYEDFSYNQTGLGNSSNITDSKFHYNQTGDFGYNQTGLGNSSNITDSKFHYNQTTGTFNATYDAATTLFQLVDDYITNTTTSGINITNIIVNGNLSINTYSNLHNFNLNGSMDLIHVSTESDDHALEIDVFAKAFGDVKAIFIDYITGALGIDKDEAVILINIDQFDAVGGDVVGLEIVTTSGGANVTGLEVGVLIHPVEQLSGIFGDMDSALNNGVDNRTSFITLGVLETMFANNGDTVTIGHSVKFEEIEFIMDVMASGAGIKPVFYHSTGVNTWDEFSPTDGTNGLRDNGVLIWLDSDIEDWAIGTGDDFLIRINRTQVGLSTPPVETLVQIAVATNYFWDRDGQIVVSRVNATNEICITGGNCLSEVSSDLFELVNDLITNETTLGINTTSIILDGNISQTNGSNFKIEGWNGSCWFTDYGGGLRDSACP